MAFIIENTTQIRVRYADTDKMGIVYNGNYLAFFEVGRTELMRSKGLAYTTFESEGYLLPLVESHVNYKAPAYYDDLLDIVATLDVDAITATLQFNYSIFCNGNFIADGYTKHSFLKQETMKPVRPPKFFIEKLQLLKII